MITEIAATRNTQIFHEKGFAIIDDVYSSEEIEAIACCIRQANTERFTFRRSQQLFAIRQFLKEVPDALRLILNTKLRKILSAYSSPAHVPVKSIYFDKPAGSNWFVAYHQDLTISVDKRTDTKDYGPWTVKQDQYAVQPPLDILQNILTVRIHLDDTDEYNGALRVLEGTHRRGILRPESLDIASETERICRVKKGSVMLMKPLLMHASRRSNDERGRRVIHIEFSDATLPDDLHWSEKTEIFHSSEKRQLSGL